MRNQHKRIVYFINTFCALEHSNSSLVSPFTLKYWHDNGMHTVMILTELQKVFDTLEHQIFNENISADTEA